MGRVDVGIDSCNHLCWHFPIRRNKTEFWKSCKIPLGDAETLDKPAKKEYDKYNNLMTNLSAYPADRFSGIRASALPGICCGDAVNGLRKHNRKTAL